jgi:hypothetical protein
LRRCQGLRGFDPPVPFREALFVELNEGESSETPCGAIAHHVDFEDRVPLLFEPATQVRFLALKGNVTDKEPHGASLLSYNNHDPGGRRFWPSPPLVDSGARAL